ncbi:dihydrofolate reductase family protein [Ornithinibacillus contaminans]|uniref:dihydrofolate reductase family protein n=1 Tax=Ornithinibacillus contaminans TaxID=694055 RepID=UPI00064DB817|nr:dihydrofolate reductase family protein [Ornithinibacillus contaminans]
MNAARKVILDLAVTLDGFIEGKNGEIDWCNMEPEMDFTKFLDQIDTILYGRKSYDIWGQYVPKEEESETEKEMWKAVHSKDKYVFSRFYKSTDTNVTFIKDNIAEEINMLKNKPGKDIWLYGGSSLITSFINLGLVDEMRLSVHPVILGEGKPLFSEIMERKNFVLVNTRSFSSGVVQLCYQMRE